MEHMYTEIAIALVAIVLAGLAYLQYRNGTPAYGAPIAPTEGNLTTHTLSLYGDSISWAASLNPTPAQALAQIATVTNYAAAGMRLRDLKQAYTALLQPDLHFLPLAEQIRQDPSVVVFCRLGINDANQDTDLDEFVSMLRQFIDVARECGKVPILGGLTRMSLPGVEPKLLKKMQDRRVQFNEAIKSVAAEQGVHFIDIDSVAFQALDVPDGLHPNQAYSNRVDQFILNYFIEHKIFV